MVPMHGIKLVQASMNRKPLPGGELLEERPAPLLGGVGGGFMVPMRAQKRMEALHEPDPLTPSLSPIGGEGVRRTGEG